MKRLMMILMVIALAALTAMPVLADRGADRGAGQGGGDHTRNQNENRDADQPNGDPQQDRDRDRDVEDVQERARERDGDAECTPEQARERDGDPARTPEPEARNRFEVRGEVVAFDPTTRMLTLRVRNAAGDGAGQAALVRVQMQAQFGPAALRAGQTLTVRGTIHEETWTAAQIRLGMGR